MTDDQSSATRPDAEPAFGLWLFVVGVIFWILGTVILISVIGTASEFDLGWSRGMQLGGQAAGPFFITGAVLSSGYYVVRYVERVWLEARDRH